MVWNWPFPVSAALLFAVILLLLVTGQTIIFLLRLVAADRRGRRRPLASGTKTVGELEDAGEAPRRTRRRPTPRPAARARLSGRGPRATIASRGASARPIVRSRRTAPVPVLATYFCVRRGRDPFFKFFMRTIFPRQVKDYEEKFGIRFIGWFNVAHGWDFDNVILLDLPDYATLDKLEADEATRALGHRAGEWIFERHHSMFLRERMGPDLEYHPPDELSTHDHLAMNQTGGRQWIRATTTCSVSSQPMPPSNALTSSSRRPNSFAVFSTTTRTASQSWAA